MGITEATEVVKVNYIFSHILLQFYILVVIFAQLYRSVVGFEPAYAPHFGSGYDTYIYGSYFGHPVYNIGLSLSFAIIINAQINGTYKVLCY